MGIAPPIFVDLGPGEVSAFEDLLRRNNLLNGGPLHAVLLHAQNDVEIGPFIGINPAELPPGLDADEARELFGRR